MTTPNKDNLKTIRDIRDILVDNNNIEFLIFSEKQFNNSKRKNNNFLSEMDGFTFNLINQFPDEYSPYSNLIYKIGRFQF